MIVEVVYLNAGPPSEVTPAETNADINAILSNWDPDILLGTEAAGDGPLPRRRPRFPGKVRDVTPVSHTNLFGYFDRQFDPKWTDMQLEFPRRPGRDGNLPPRAFYRGDYHGAQVIDAHHPPGWRGTGAARLEHRLALEKTFAPWLRPDWEEIWDTPEKRARAKARPRLLGWDSNMSDRVVRGFAHRIGGWVVGEHIDCLIIRNMVVVGEPIYTRKVGNHFLHTDHPWGCLRVRLQFQKG